MSVPRWGILQRQGNESPGAAGARAGGEGAGKGRRVCRTRPAPQDSLRILEWLWGGGGSTRAALGAGEGAGQTPQGGSGSPD